MNNTSKNVNISFKGQTKTLKQWAEYFNSNYKYLHSLIKYKGKTLEEIYGQ
jgi:hypothetical protein